MRCKACNAVYQPTDIEFEDGSTKMEECCPECVSISLDDTYEPEESEIKLCGQYFRILDANLYIV